MIKTRYICKTEEDIKIVCSYLEIEKIDSWLRAFDYSHSTNKHLSINHLDVNSFTQCVGYCSICNNKTCSIINYDVVNANTLMREKKLKRILK